MKARLNLAVNEIYQSAVGHARLFLGVLADLGRTPDESATILDLGCGEGWLVYAIRKLGYRAFGADIVSVASVAHARMKKEGLCGSDEQPFSLIDPSNCRIPYGNDSFDLVVSYDLMEHVKNYPAVFAEIERVLKPSGKSLHSFPSRYRPIEPHVSIPLATVFQQYRFLLFWSWLGFGLGNHKRSEARQIALENFRYLKTSTQYLPKKKLVNSLKRHFRDVQFVEKCAWRYDSGVGGLIYRFLERLGLVRLVPIAALLLSHFCRRVLFFAEPLHANKELFSNQALSPEPWSGGRRAVQSASGGPAPHAEDLDEDLPQLLAKHQSNERALPYL